MALFDRRPSARRPQDARPAVLCALAFAPITQPIFGRLSSRPLDPRGLGLLGARKLDNENKLSSPTLSFGAGTGAANKQTNERTHDDRHSLLCVLVAP